MKEDRRGKEAEEGRRGQRGGESGVRVCLNTEGVQSGVFAGARASGSKDKRGWGGWALRLIAL